MRGEARGEKGSEGGVGGREGGGGRREGGRREVRGEWGRREGREEERWVAIYKSHSHTSILQCVQFQFRSQCMKLLVQRHQLFPDLLDDL